MTIAERLLPEYDYEMGTTRKLLERVPDGRADWKPHVKSMPLGHLTIHLATLPTYAKVTLTQTEVDVNPPGGPAYQMPEFDSTAVTLEAFDENVRSGRAAIAAASDDDLRVTWTLKNGGRTIFSQPRVGVLRTFFMNHLIHHRGQLSVYLRLLDVPLPSIYGPTADEPM